MFYGIKSLANFNSILIQINCYIKLQLNLYSLELSKYFDEICFICLERLH